MFFRMVVQALVRQWKKMIMIAFTISLGSSLATAMLNVMFDVGDKVNQELKTYGANIRVVPQTASILNDLYGVEGAQAQYLREDELGKIKTIFWSFNIVDFAPYLEDIAILENNDGSFTETNVVGTWFSYHLDLPTGETLDTGMTAMKKWWSIEGNWIKDDEENLAMIGTELAAKKSLKIGDKITLFEKKDSQNKKETTFTICGIFDAGSDEDEKIYLTLHSAQKLFSKQGVVSSIDVSALTTPDNELARRAAQNPESLNIVDWDTWYCTAYVSSICYQLQEVITNSTAKAVRQVAESEGAILNKTQLLMLLITILSLIGSALGISNLVTASVMERSQEIGLLKAIGAYNGAVMALVLTEILITAIIGGACGYFAGLGFAQIIGQSVFESNINIKLSVIPIVAVLIFVVTMAGSIPSIKMLLHLEPAEVLHGR
ncbi:MAG: ABC transporter permease [Treponema sp.]|nr:ABC transporter permease [Treponema sp.]